jgi:phage-related protein
MITAPPPWREKPVEFMGSALEDLASFPRWVKLKMGFAIYQAQLGNKHQAAKPLTGHKEFRGAGAMEVVDDFDGDAYRAVYTVKFAGVVYVLHAFQKKATKGAQTPRREIDLIKKRLLAARRHYEEIHLRRNEKRVADDKA